MRRRDGSGVGAVWSAGLLQLLEPLVLFLERVHIERSLQRRRFLFHVRVDDLLERCCPGAFLHWIGTDKEELLCLSFGVAELETKRVLSL